MKVQLWKRASSRRTQGKAVVMSLAGLGAVAAAVTVALYHGKAHAQPAPDPQAIQDQTSGEEPGLPVQEPSPQREQAPPLVPHALLPSLVPTPIPGADQNLGGNNYEPTLAVDPHNPNHVATATYLRLRVSTNAGASFQPAVPAAVPAGFSSASGGDSSLAYDSQGRLYWTYLLQLQGTNRWDVFIARCDPNTGAIQPGYPVNVSAAAGSAAPLHNNDKEWLAVDSHTNSPFRDRIYIVWTDFIGGTSVVRTATSANLGLNWGTAITLSAGGEGFVWPSHNAVAPNGDVFAAYHSQPTFGPGGWVPNGTSGQILVLRSTDGGGTYPQKNAAYTAGNADITFNVQGTNGTIPATKFWLQGSAQPWVLADPSSPGRIYVIANDDPDNTHGSGREANVNIVISTNNGVNWSAPQRIDDGPGTTFQVLPTAAMDPSGTCLAVHFYDNRRGLTNASGDFLLDVFLTSSTDGGLTFSPSIRINDAPFDPETNAPCRFGPAGCGSPGPNATSRTLRIGEYNGIAVGGGVVSSVWTGNDASGFQQTFFDVFACIPCTLTCPANLTTTNDPGFCGAVVSFSPPGATGGCGPVTSTPPSGSFFPVGTNTVVASSLTGSSCAFTVTVHDVEPPAVTSSITQPLLWPPLHNLINVGLEVTATDNCAGALPVAVRVFANEDDEMPTADGNFSPDAKDLAPDTLRLREERRGDGAGRVYLIVAYAADAAGNVGFAASTVVVPRDPSPHGLNAVNALATAAKAYCDSNNGAPPPGYFLIGDGPLLGPKQ